jgi:hypothetical protein
MKLASTASQVGSPVYGAMRTMALAATFHGTSKKCKYGRWNSSRRSLTRDAKIAAARQPSSPDARYSIMALQVSGLRVLIFAELRTSEPVVMPETAHEHAQPVRYNRSSRRRTRGAARRLSALGLLRARVLRVRCAVGSDRAEAGTDTTVGHPNTDAAGHSSTTEHMRALRSEAARQSVVGAWVSPGSRRFAAIRLNDRDRDVRERMSLNEKNRLRRPQ